MSSKLITNALAILMLLSAYQMFKDGKFELAMNPKSMLSEHVAMEAELHRMHPQPPSDFLPEGYKLPDSAVEQKIPSHSKRNYSAFLEEGVNKPGVEFKWIVAWAQMLLSIGVAIASVLILLGQKRRGYGVFVLCAACLLLTPGLLHLDDIATASEHTTILGRYYAIFVGMAAVRMPGNLLNAFVLIAVLMASGTFLKKA